MTCFFKFSNLSSIRRFRSNLLQLMSSLTCSVTLFLVIFHCSLTSSLRYFGQSFAVVKVFETVWQKAFIYKLPSFGIYPYLSFPFRFYSISCINVPWGSVLSQVFFFFSLMTFYLSLHFIIFPLLCCRFHYSLFLSIWNRLFVHLTCGKGVAIKHPTATFLKVLNASKTLFLIFWFLFFLERSYYFSH